jgi:apoptosis-inducing factor 2
MAAKTNAQTGLVANNIKVYFEGIGKVQEYKGFPEMILVTNGKDAGVGYFPFLWGIMLGPFFAKMLKSKGLMIGRMRASVGY